MSLEFYLYYKPYSKNVLRMNESLAKYIIIFFGWYYSQYYSIVSIDSDLQGFFRRT